MWIGLALARIYKTPPSLAAMKVQEVFTPGDFPEHTYVERGQGQLENRVEHQLRRDGAIVSLSGPSKSGKSVLIEQVVGSDNLVEVYGGEIESTEHLWDLVLDELGAPQSTESTSGTTEESQLTGSFGIRTHLFNAGGSASETESTTDETVEVYGRRGLDDILEVNDVEQFVLLIDDFHYLSPELQTEIGEALKQASEGGLRICVALIPHRSDDLTQANPDLQGRALTLQLEYWDREDLMRIGEKGFQALNVSLPRDATEIFAKESAGSPHLMQQLCYDACGVKDIAESKDTLTEVGMGEDQIEDVLGWTGASLDLDEVFDILNGEGISGKTQRDSHDFIDGTEGDVYESILRGIADDSLQNELDQSEEGLDRSKLVEAIKRQCANSPPPLPSITQALERMDERITETHPESAIFEWKSDTNKIQLPDPYLIFYLRWSDKLDYKPML